MPSNYQKGATSSKDPNWNSPPDMFQHLHSLFDFTIDLASSHDNALLPLHFTQEDDALGRSWAGHRGWLNPPYGGKIIPKWLEKCHAEFLEGTPLTVVLVPARIAATYFHIYTQLATSIWFIHGRLTFLRDDTKKKESNAFFPSMFYIWSQDPLTKYGVPDDPICTYHRDSGLITPFKVRNHENTIESIRSRKDHKIQK